MQNGGCARLSDVENAILDRERVPDTDNPRLYGLEHQDAIRSVRSSLFGREQYEEYVDQSPHHITRMDPFLVAPCQALRKSLVLENDKRAKPSSRVRAVGLRHAHKTAQRRCSTRYFALVNSSRQRVSGMELLGLHATPARL